MSYSDLIKRNLKESRKEISLVGFLNLIDAYDKSAPSLTELNINLEELAREGYLEQITKGLFVYLGMPGTSNSIDKVTEEEYQKARTESHERIIQILEGQGIS